MSMLTVYFFVMMDNFIIGFIVAACIAALGVIASGLNAGDAREEPKKKYWHRWAYAWLTAMCLFITLAVITPNTKQFAAIYLIPKVVNNEDVRAMSGDAMKAVRIKFNEWIDELDPVEEAKKVVTENN